MDGSLGGRGAYFTEPYSDAPDTYGAMIHTPEEIDALVKRANDMGLQIGVHCIGDKAIDCVVSAIEKAYAENPRPDARFRLIHVLGINRELIERCRKLPIMFDVQPKFLASDVHWAEDRLGPDRSPYGFAWKKLIDAGFVVTGSSFEEKIKGTIAPGKLADFILLDADPYAVPPAELKNIRVLKTYLGGEVTFE